MENLDFNQWKLDDNCLKHPVVILNIRLSFKKYTAVILV